MTGGAPMEEDPFDAVLRRSTEILRGSAGLDYQEVYDSQGRGQPEILEKGRKCEALGAEVMRTSVGPELFAVLLHTLEETGYFNASLYTPYSVAGIETLGAEIARQVRAETGRRTCCGARAP
ncbi:hypothetical protein [Couchioplanes caeruleus]|uniref:Uncharacterized protein n=1 Tax=Couchioplanes caeruleus subsp. caeruleus TaxID=56427 RepID=A0A1K0FTA8_9ACTN|nr:hypothetical protein [Couchioplanes caeruleus]OJF15896.1 hypothetical protein BG844_01260 [Couchioplanes caeruleus subsp. caeruleus]